MSAGPAFAQTGGWATSGPVGGNVYCVVAAPGSPSTLYAGTSQGVFRSDDAGAHWALTGAGIPASRVQAIAVDPSAPGTLYAGTLTPAGVPSVGIFKSTDFGATWASVNDGLSDPFNGVAPLDVASLAIDPNHPGTVLAGTMYSEIFKSTDGGASWVPQTFGGFSVSLQTFVFQFDPSNSATVYAATSLGLLKSLDNGLDWDVYGTSVPLFAMAIDPSSPQTLYAGNAAGQGMLKSTDGGAHWQLANTGLPVLHDSAGDYSPLVVALSVDPANPASVYAGTYGSGLFESTNRAGSWSASSSGIRNTFVSALAIAPSASPSTLYAGTLGGGVSQSSDGAQSWTASNAGLDSSVVDALVLDPGAPDTLYAGTSDGIAKSGDGGRSWQAANSGFPVSPVSALVLSPGSPTALFAGTMGGGVFKSSDNGSSWSASTSGFSGELYISSIAVDPTSASTLYAGTAHPYDGSHSERVFKSTTGGGSWTQTSLDASGFSVDFIAVNPAKASQVVAGSHATTGYFQSLDSGKTWSTVSSDGACGGLNAFVFDAAGAVFYIAGTAGVCRSSDGGKTWQVAAVGGSLSVETLRIDPTSPSTLYAGTSLNGSAGAGVYRSSDGGQTWEALGTGLAPVAVTALAIDPAGRTIHASTHGAGVSELSIGTDRPAIHPPPPRRTKVLNPR